MTDNPEQTAWFFESSTTPPDVFTRQCLDFAKDLRQDVYLDFKHKMNVVYQAKTVCVGMSTTVARFFMRHQSDYTPYQGMVLSGYFDLRIQGKTYPCQFDSVVLQTVTRNDSIIVDVRLPQQIRHQQRRNNVRIPIKRNDISNHKLWTHNTQLDASVSKQHIEWAQFTPNFYEMIDMSAGGMLMTISDSSPLYETLNAGSLFFSTGTFHESVKRKYELGIVSTVLRKFDTSDNNWYSFGTRFVRWALCHNGNYNWQTVDPEDGVPPLAQWILYVSAQRKKMTNFMP